MQQPHGFVVKGQGHEVCLFLKAIYGLKQTQELGTFKWMHSCVRMVLLEVIQIIIFTFPFNMVNMSSSS